MTRYPLILLFSFSVLPAASIRAEAEVSFNEKIQPILSEYCYHCHGPDSGTREPKKSPLRLDLKAEAFAPRSDGKAVILPGDAAGSELVKRMKTKDVDDIMPPPKSHKTMKPKEIALLEKWIAQGAKYEDHWAFLPVTKPPVPAAGGGWAANPIDHFVAEKLEAAKMAVNPVEDARRLFRRLSFDLTGLPPAPVETEAFAKAAEANLQTAVEAAADKMLASTASAEHFARHWLDVARYADTHGIHIDNFRNIWPYRDWVIEAFRQNMPWDQFTVEQIAGDLLPAATLEQKIATGFHRCLPTTGEGGAIPEEYDAIYAKDRVDTTASAWLGLTTGCASCHDHKFDPFSMKDFYSMSAFFRNTSMSALDGNNASHAPVIFVPAAVDRTEWNALPGKIAEVDRKLAEREKLARGEFEKWLPTASISVPALDPASLLLHFPLTEAEGPVIGKIGGKEVKAAATVQRQDGIIGKALRVDSAVVDLGKGWDLKRQDAVTIMARVFIEGKPNGAILAKMASAPSFRGWDLFLEQGKVATHAISDWQANADKIASNDALEPGKWHHIAVTFNGPAKKDRQAIYVNGKAVKTTAFVEALRSKATIENDLPLLIGSRNGGDNKVNGVVAMQDLKVVNRLLTPQEIGAIGGGQALKDALAIASDKRTKQQTDLLYQYYLSAQDSAGNALRQEKASLTSRMAEMKARGSDSLVMDERPNKQPYAHILTRGEYTAKADKVDANTPSALPPLAPDAPRNRLGLAKWLVNPANPLPARVTVNRVWAYLIGNGIVETTGDFGIMGARPTHPELLDWLAASFVESKWDHRRLVKAIVTSATYRQSAAVSPEKLEKDPFNRLLARGARPRLDGEQIRDMALAASGLLVDKVGGAPVRPYQPEGIWESVAMKESNTRFYKPDEGDSLYRRSLYTIWKRIAPHPTMEILNAPSREVSCVRRDRTNTPLQAFVTMNDPQFVESAKFLAASTLKAAPDFDGRLNYISNRLISRVFTDVERAALRGTFDKALATFQAQPAEAGKYLATGAKAAPADLPVPELAAWTFLSSQVLNLDEALVK